MIRNEIDNLLADAGDGLSAEIRYPADFSGFDGHFPGTPIVPAICQVLTAQLILERHLGRRVELRGVHRAAFRSIVGPERPLRVQVSATASDPTRYTVAITDVADGSKVSGFIMDVGAEVAE